MTFSRLEPMDRLTVAAGAWLLACSFCFAQKQSDPVRTQSPQLLVLTNGRVVSGRIVPRAGGYDILEPGGGRVYVPHAETRFEAKNLDDAYRKFRATFRELTVPIHLQLARWCVTNQQIAHARRELLAALHLEPTNSIARSMLRKLEASQIRPRKRATPPARRSDHFTKRPHESLAGLTGRQAAAFVSRVQPILERRCGNSSCHGSRSTSGFSLSRTRGRSSRLVSERNLAQVLKHIDFRRPENSAIMTAIDKPHTRDGRPVMPGRDGRVQREVVLKWVQSLQTVKVAAADKSPMVAVAKPPTAHRRSGAVKPVSHVVVPANAEEVRQGEEQAQIQAARDAAQPDPFDPAEFNRKQIAKTKRRTNDNRSSKR